MKKWQLIIPVAIILVVGLFVGGFAVKNRQRNFIIGITGAIGDNLIAFTNSSHLDHIEPGLETQLSELLSAKTQVAHVLLGDASPPIGDGRAYSQLVLTNDAGARLLIRLQPTGKPGMFKVLGFTNSFAN